MSTNPTQVTVPVEEPTPPGLPRLRGPIFHRATLVPQQGTTELLLVRHAQAKVPDGVSETSRDDLYDPRLSEHGRRQAERLADALAGSPIAAVYSSDLRRARETAEAVASRHGVEVTLWEELREYDAFCDVPEGESVRSWVPEALLRGMSERFVRERRWESFPFSEPPDRFRSRVASAHETMLAADPGGRIVAVSHGGVMNAYLAHLLDLRADVFFNAAHASISRVVAWGDRRAVHTLNEQHHLGDLVDY